MEKIDRGNAEHYNWKTVCDGWHFVRSDALSIIAEKMPPHTAEDAHYHVHAKQFFYLLCGEAVMHVRGESVTLKAGEAIVIEPMEAHQMTNVSDEDTEFLVVSTPKSHGDRVLVSL